MNIPISKYLVSIGILLVIIGITWHFFGDKLGWIGNLPGDIKVENENSKIYFPITTMILFSILLSVGLALFRKFF